MTRYKDDLNPGQIEGRVRRLESSRLATLRFGRVVSVDPGAGTARVQLPDADNMVSYDLRVAQHRTLKDQHQHLPDVGEHVACLFSGQGFEEGVIFGAVYSKADPAPGREPHLAYYRFEDGTELEYDRRAHKLTGVVQGSVDIKVAENLTGVIEGSVDIKVKEKVEVEALGAVNIRSALEVSLEAPLVSLRCASLNIGGLPQLGAVCAATIEADLKWQGDLEQVGNQAIEGKVAVSGSIIDGGGNTPNHSHGE